MAATAKVQYYSDLAERSTDQLTASREQWTAYLTTAARLYKYPFDEQLMIFAQRPDATACAPIETWNKPMNRWVKRGSKGIALLYEQGGKSRLRYVFDVSDTEDGRRNLANGLHSRKPHLWELKPEYEAPVMEALAKSHDSDIEGNLGNILYEIAGRMAQEYLDDNAQDIEYSIEGSFLEELDGFNIGVAFKEALTVSTAYSLMSRCGLDAAEYFEAEDFQPIFDFNTPDSVYALGTAVSELSEQVLREIEVAIKKQERQQAAERSTEHGELDVQRERGLSDPRPDIAGADRGTIRQIRPYAPDVPEGTPSDIVQFPASERAVISPPAGDRPDSQPEAGAVDDGIISEAPGSGQEDRADGMGTAPEQPETASGGTDLDGAGVPLKEDAPVEAPPVQTASLREVLAGSSISPDAVNDILRDGGNQNNSVLRIAAWYMKNKPSAENADFLKREYRSGGKGFLIGQDQIAVWFDETGMKLGKGRSALQAADSVHLSWEQAAVCVREMLDNGQYLSRDRLEESLDNEFRETAEQLWSFYRDDLNGIPDEWNVNGSGFPDSTTAIKSLLQQPEQLTAIIDRLEMDIDMLEQEEPPRRLWHSPVQVLQAVWDCQTAPQIFPANETLRHQIPAFITEDEVNTFLTKGSNIESSKYRIFSHFLHEHTAKEQADFVKSEYANGGGGHALSGADGSSYDGFHGRLKLSRNYDAVELTWSKAAERINGLINEGRYMTHAELDLLPEYEKNTLAGEIVSFYYNLPEDIKRPYPAANDVWGGGNRQAVRKMLDDPAKVEEMLASMTPVWENTPPMDRYYDTRQAAYRDLTAFKDGAFTLFPQLSALAPAETETAVITDVRPEPFQQTSLFADWPPPPLPGVEEQREIIENAETEVEEQSSAFSISQEDIDTLLCEAVENPAVKLEIDRQFKENPRSREATQMIKAAYGRLAYTSLHFIIDTGTPSRTDRTDGYRGLIGEEKGITITKGSPATVPLSERPPAAILTLPWLKVQKRIAELVEAGNYLTADELAPPEQAAEPEYQDNAPTATTETPVQDAPGGPEPVFFVDWDTAQSDFNLRLYNDHDVIGYNKDGVEYAIGRSGSLTYVTSTGAFWGSNTVPGNIYEQINAYQNGELTNEQVRENYLKVLSLFTEQQDTPLPEPGLTAEPAAVPVTSEPALPAQIPANFRITDEHLGEGGAKTKYGWNVAAIRTLKEIEAQGRLATQSEQEILSRYVGWGGLPQAFDGENGSWSREYSELQDLLTPEEYELARASTLNAHYTSPTVIRSIYDTVERLGFRNGNILEPACGVGNFFGLMPESMQNAKLYGVELDSITGRIAAQLYQKADIAVSGFEKTNRPDAFFDLAIGNVPFGQYKVLDKRYDKHNFLIHDYFFAKTLDQVRPGGIVALVTSKGTLDKRSPEVRKYLAQRAELLGAVRLPNTAFQKNAGTEVTSDILFFQKRDRMMDIQPDWVFTGQTEDGIPINSYFAEHPEMVLGTMAYDDRFHGNRSETTCTPVPGADLAEQLQAALANIQGQITEVDLDDIGELADRSMEADPNVKNYSYTVLDDAVYFRENSRMYPVDLPATTLERIKGMVSLRECVNELIDYQLDEYGDEAIKGKQTELNRIYDDFTVKYGLISSTANSRAFSEDSAYYLLTSLEELDENGNLERKADMFSKRTIKQKTVVTSVDTASEALAVSIAERASVDMGFMQSLTGFSEEKLTADLQGVIFRDLGDQPEGMAYAFVDLEKRPLVTADEYLSGNVRSKLQAAKTLAEKRPELAARIAPNIQALTLAQLKDLDASEISVRLGSTWVDKAYIEQFTHEVLQTPYYLRDVIHVNYFEYTGEWQVTGTRRVPGNDVPANVTYGTSRMNAYQIIADTLNLKDVRVYDTIYEDGKEKRVLNKNETTKAQQKQEVVKQAFKDWIWKDPERRQTLVKLYNERFNSTRPREYDGSHLAFSGINPEINLRSHQLNAIAHVMYGGNTLLAHEVGAGKTFEMVAAAMESKRLGLCQKSLFAVPNHLTEQWASEFLRLYPSANILIATKKDFEMKNRKKFCAKIATGDYDAVIVGHSQMEKIPMSKERQERLLREQIWEITEGIDEVKRNDGERFTVKQLEKTKKSLETRLDKLTDDSRKDDVVTFEQLGVDRLFVDEAHSFKNLFLYTKMRNVAGISQTEAQKSSDLFMKCRYMDELTDGKGIIFATGTPISNSMTEMYTMQRYLQYETLRKNNLTHFDAWASTFGETVTAIELAPEGTGYRARTRFAKFHNLPELMCMFKEVADIKTADTLDLPRPKANFQTVVVEPSGLQQDMVSALSERAAAVHRNMVDPRDDNMLKITSDGRKIGLDQRLINPMLPDDEASKVNACMNNIYEIWRDTKADRLTQLAFCDFSTPNADGRFNVYDDIRTKLLEKGIPDSEIAFIHEANTETRKKELFAKVRQGKVRVLFGSTFKMGSGTNVQDRLIALHDLDCPWRPSDLEQRAGRIVRQGNQNPEVDIFRYVTEGTFDAYLYQTVENKQKFISQIMTSKSPVRACEDVDEAALSYAEIKALCAGNPLIREKMDLDIEVARLRLLKADHQSQHYKLEDNLLKYFPESIEKARGQIAGFESDKTRLEAGTRPNADGFSPMEIHGVMYADKDKAGAALLTACAKITSAEPVKIGSYRGFDMNLSFDSMQKHYRISLKGSMSYGTELGTDTYGNIIRMNNTLADMPQRLTSVQVQLDNLQKQQVNAKQELEKPFPYEQNLADKSARLALLDAELNMDKSGQEQPQQTSEEVAAKQERRASAKEKPSILASLKAAREEMKERPTERPDKSKETCL